MKKHDEIQALRDAIHYLQDEALRLGLFRVAELLAESIRELNSYNGMPRKPPGKFLGN